MYNYNRDVAQAEFERTERMWTARERQVPEHLRIDQGKRIATPLAKLSGPTASALKSFASLIGREAARYWRRASSRAAGLIENAAKTVVPGY